jgi:hypothetical protein
MIMAVSKEEPRHMENMGAQCEFCAGRSFRRSHLQFKDMLPLLLFRYPVRCLLCSKRQPVSLVVAQRALSSKSKQVRTPRSDTPWSGWNSSDGTTGGTMPLGAGGRGFSALPVHSPISMPNLTGVALEHHRPLTADNEDAV